MARFVVRKYTRSTKQSRSPQSKKDSTSMTLDSTQSLTAGKEKTLIGSKKAADPFPCERIGKKRSDLRCRTPDGEEWASPLEARIYYSLRRDGHLVRRSGTNDALHYTTAVKQGRCVSCNSCEIVQDRTYTPDLIVQPLILTQPDIMLEIKGYFTGPKRNLFRAARQSNPSADIRLIVSSDHAVTKGKTRLSDWAKRFRIPFAVWDGTIPEKL